MSAEYASDRLSVGAPFLDGTRRAFADACRSIGAAGVRELEFRFAGHPVRMRVAGVELAKILQRCFWPFVDCIEDEAVPALSVSAWDRSQTGVGCPGIPVFPDTTDVLGSGLLSQYSGGRVLRYERADVVKSFDRFTGELLLCVRDVCALNLNDRAKPFQHSLATWYLDHGVLLLHAGAVSRNGRGVLFCGMSGAGKSTNAVACALAGYDFLGDDVVGVRQESERTIVHACYASARCGPRNLDWHSELEPVSIPPAHTSDRGKSLFYIPELRPDGFATSAPLAALVTTSIRGIGGSKILPTGRAATLRTLAPSTLLRGLGAGASGFASIMDLVRRHPCYEIAIGATPKDVPALVDRLLEDIDL